MCSTSGHDVLRMSKLYQILVCTPTQLLPRLLPVFSCNCHVGRAPPECLLVSLLGPPAAAPPCRVHMFGTHCVPVEVAEYFCGHTLNLLLLHFACCCAPPSGPHTQLSAAPNLTCGCCTSWPCRVQCIPSDEVVECLSPTACCYCCTLSAATSALFRGSI